MTASTKPIALAYGEAVIAVVPEYCSGPGWRNAPLWVYIRANDGKLRTECIQPTERTAEQHTLFDIGARLAQQLIGSVAVKQAKR
jgi:hypothetical protein